MPPRRRPPSKPVFFADAADLRAWLEAHHADATELLLGLTKQGAAEKGLTYPEALDEALCFGWIDGVTHTIDDERWQVRFTPRRKGSIWSDRNVANVARLSAEGRMRPAGLAAFAAREEARTGVYGFERDREPALDPARAARLSADREAARFFFAQSPSYRRMAIHWVVSAKKDETKDRRLEQLLAASRAGRVAPPFAYGTRKPK